MRLQDLLATDGWAIWYACLTVVRMQLTNAATSNADAVIGVTPSASTGDGVAR